MGGESSTNHHKAESTKLEVGKLGLGVGNPGVPHPLYDMYVHVNFPTCDFSCSCLHVSHFTCIDTSFPVPVPSGDNTAVAIAVPIVVVLFLIVVVALTVIFVFVFFKQRRTIKVRCTGCAVHVHVQVLF